MIHIQRFKVLLLQRVEDPYMIYFNHANSYRNVAVCKGAVAGDLDPLFNDLSSQRHDGMIVLKRILSCTFFCVNTSQYISIIPDWKYLPYCLVDLVLRQILWSAPHLTSIL